MLLRHRFRRNIKDVEEMDEATKPGGKCAIVRYEHCLPQ